MEHFLQNICSGQTPEDLNQNSWKVWPLSSEYDHNVHLRLKTVEQTCMDEQPVTVLQGQTKKVCFQESRELGPPSKNSCYYRLDQLELTSAPNFKMFNTVARGRHRALGVSKLGVRRDC